MRKLRRTLMAALSLIVMVSVFGCGPKAANAPLEAPGDLSYERLHTKERFRKYERIGIRPFDSSETTTLSVDADEEAETNHFVRRASEYIEEGFLDEMKGNYYHGFGIVDSDEDASDYDLIIEGKVMEVDRGSAAARFWGVGGATRVMVSGRMIETATGEVVADFRDFKIGTGSLASIPLLEINAREIGRNLSDFLEEVY